MQRISHFRHRLRRLWLWIAISVVGYLLASCLSLTPQPSPTVRDELNALDYFSRIAQIQGYLRSAEELVNIDQFDRAFVQLQPIDRVYADLAQVLDLSPRFLISLYNLRQQLSIEAFAQKPFVADQYHRAVKHLDALVESSQFQQSLSLPLRLRVIEQQLLAVAQSYKVAVSSPNTIDQASFDRARGILLAASDRWINPIRDQLKETNPLLSNQMQSAVSTLTASLPATPEREKMPEVQQIEKTIADFVEASRRLVG